jgi:Peptidase family M23
MTLWASMMLAGAIAGAFTGVARAQQSPAPYNDPLFMSVTAMPAPNEAAILDGAGRKHTAYELYVTNFGATPVKIVQLEAVAMHEGQQVASESKTGAQLAAMFAPAGQDRMKPHDPLLQPGQAGIFFIFADLDPAHELPDRFLTAFKIESHGEHAGSGTIHPPAIKSSNALPIVIRSPVLGKNWAAMNGPSNTSPHRRAVLFQDGLAHIGQRYAIDWVQLGDDGNTFTGDQSQNRSYHAWDVEIHAVGDGTIVTVKDGIPENVPNSPKLATEMTVDTLPGNHIIEDLGGGHFAAYAHLRPGTLKVKAGDHVHAGDVLGHLGNTGNSSEPHLHFQICDAPSFSNSEGLPFAIDSFTREDHTIDKLGSGQKLAVRSTHHVEREEPMENELDTF